jgi:flagellin
VLTVQSESLTASESQIRDANMAEEVVNMTKYQVLNQTGLAALAQANAASQSVLALLG